MIRSVSSFVAFIAFAEIDRVVNGRDAEPRSSKRFCDVTKDKPIKVTVRTAVPTRDHPKVSNLTILSI